MCYKLKNLKQENFILCFDLGYMRPIWVEIIMHSTTVHKIHCECCKKIEKLIGQNFLNLNQWERQLKQILKYILCTLCLKVKTNHYWEMSLIWDDLSLRISFRYSKKSAVSEICNTMWKYTNFGTTIECCSLNLLL